MCVCVILCHRCSCRDQKKCVCTPGAGVTGGIESSYGCWELNLGPLEKQYELNHSAIFLIDQKHLLTRFLRLPINHSLNKAVSKLRMCKVVCS